MNMINYRRKIAMKVKSSPYNDILINNLKLLQRKVKSNITRFLKIQGEKTLSSTNRRDSWKFIKNVTNNNKAFSAPQVDVEELNNFFQML